MSDRGPAARHLLVGGYTSPRGAAGGLVLLEHDRPAGTLRALDTLATPSPSALASGPDGRTVFAVEEDDPGQVHSFLRSGGGLVARSCCPSGGADPCHLALDPSGRWLLVANYSGATVASLVVGAEGDLAGPVSTVHFTRRGPDPDRQDASHPHMVSIDATGTEVLVADLGADAVHRLRLDPGTGALATAGKSITLPAGTGPRQILTDGDGLGYVLGELDGSLWVLELASGRVLGTVRPDGLPAGNLAAALIPAAEPGHLLASHRGADIVTRIDVRRPEAPAITATWTTATGGPRHLAIDGDWRYEACEHDNAVTAYRVSTASVIRFRTPTPTYVLPLQCANGSPGPDR